MCFLMCCDSSPVVPPAVRLGRAHGWLFSPPEPGCCLAGLLECRTKLVCLPLWALSGLAAVAVARFCTWSMWQMPSVGCSLGGSIVSGWCLRRSPSKSSVFFPPGSSRVESIAQQLHFEISTVTNLPPTWGNLLNLCCKSKRVWLVSC